MNKVINRRTKFIDLGRMDYKAAWDYQTSLFDGILEVKKRNRERTDGTEEATDNYLLFCEHDHVYTLGKNGKEDNLLVKQDNLTNLNASYYHINRGGDITYHGPGQLVAYPILDLDNFFTDVHLYMRTLEETVIRTIAEFGVQAGRIPGWTGVWVNAADKMSARKICAFGIKMSRWVTLHGLALNVNTDLSYFNHIVPCGLENTRVTSIERETGKKITIHDVSEVLKRNFAIQFDMEYS